jgi:hypothetical protein
MLLAGQLVQSDLLPTVARELVTQWSSATYAQGLHTTADTALHNRPAFTQTHHELPAKS